MEHNTDVGIGIRCKLTRGISGGRATRPPVAPHFNLKTRKKKRILPYDGRESGPDSDWIAWYISGVNVVIYSGGDGTCVCVNCREM
jgi:hypothetical protein